MVAAKVLPDALTYDRMILVCLRSDPDYKDAMRYYAEMRAKGFEPRFGTLTTLVRVLTRRR